MLRYQFSVSEPKRTEIVQSLVERFIKSQSEFAVKVETVRIPIREPKIPRSLSR